MVYKISTLLGLKATSPTMDYLMKRFPHVVSIETQSCWQGKAFFWAYMQSISAIYSFKISQLSYFWERLVVIFYGTPPTNSKTHTLLWNFLYIYHHRNKKSILIWKQGRFSILLLKYKRPIPAFPYGFFFCWGERCCSVYVSIGYIYPSQEEREGDDWVGRKTGGVNR